MPNRSNLLKMYSALKLEYNIDPTQAKCRLLISSIFYAMNFRHFLKMLEFNLWHFCKIS